MVLAVLLGGFLAACSLVGDGVDGVWRKTLPGVRSRHAELGGRRVETHRCVGFVTVSKKVLGFFGLQNSL